MSREEEAEESTRRELDTHIGMLMEKMEKLIADHQVQSDERIRLVARLKKEFSEKHASRTISAAAGGKGGKASPRDAKGMLPQHSSTNCT